MTDEESGAIARVTMQWPPALKERVREVAGGRNMTKYVIEAVEAKLDGQGAHDVVRKELWEVKFLCQQLADALALQGDYEDRISTLRALDLPAWIQTDGWAEEVADVVPVEDSTPEPVQATEMGSEAAGPLEHQVTVFKDGEATHYVDGEQVEPTPERKSHSNDLFRRITAKAAEKGIDLGGVDLKPASTIDRPEVKTLTAEDVGWELKNEEPYSEAQIKQLDEYGIDDGSPMESTGEVFETTEALVEHLDKAGNAHNHSWERMEDPHGIYTGQAYICECGSSMDSKRVYAFGEAPSKEPEVEPTDAPESASARCAACQDELIDGECWSCM